MEKKKSTHKFVKADEVFERYFEDSVIGPSGRTENVVAFADGKWFKYYKTFYLPGKAENLAELVRDRGSIDIGFHRGPILDYTLWIELDGKELKEMEDEVRYFRTEAENEAKTYHAAIYAAEGMLGGGMAERNGYDN